MAPKVTHTFVKDIKKFGNISLFDNIKNLIIHFTIHYIYLNGATTLDLGRGLDASG